MQIEACVYGVNLVHSLTARNPEPDKQIRCYAKGILGNMSLGVEHYETLFVQYGSSRVWYLLALKLDEAAEWEGWATGHALLQIDGTSYGYKPCKLYVAEPSDISSCLIHYADQTQYAGNGVDFAGPQWMVTLRRQY